MDVLLSASSTTFAIACQLTTMSDIKAEHDVEDQNSDAAAAAVDEDDRDEEEEVDPLSAKHDGGPAAPSPDRKRKRSEQIQRKAQIKDIRELVEHLIVVGNYHRHQDWRRKEYQRRCVRASAASAAVATKQEEEVESFDEEESSVDYSIDSNIQPIFLNVEDNLVYGQNRERGGGDSINFWPNPPSSARPRIMPDHQWETLWGDGVNPIAFSNQRLSESSYDLVEPNGDPKIDLLHPRHASESIDPSQATRSILLKCWHRAVHAASQTTIIDTASLLGDQMATDPLSTGNKANRPTQQWTGPCAVEQSQQSFEKLVGNGNSASDSLPLSLDFSKACGKDSSTSSRPVANWPRGAPEQETNLNEPVSDSSDDVIAYSAERAREMCERLGIALSRGPENGNSFCCPVCQVDTASLKCLETHYYGKPTARGCCWRRIKQRRATLVDQALKAEVSLQARQLAQLTAMRSIEAIKCLRGHSDEDSEPAYNDDMFRPTFDWSHVDGILRELVSSGRGASEQTGGSQFSGLLETIDARLSVTNEKDQSSSLPPLHLNRFTLEATTNRLQERYTRIPM